MALNKRTGNFNRYCRWRKFVRHWEPEAYPLKKDGNQKFGLVVLRSVALAIADHGNNGDQCFPSADVIATEVPCGLTTVKACRSFLVEQGLFKEISGEHAGRIAVLDISIPGEPEEPEEKPAPRQPVAKVPCGRCDSAALLSLNLDGTGYGRCSLYGCPGMTVEEAVKLHGESVVYGG